MIPSLSILFMAVSALLSIGIPVGLWFYFHKKYGAGIVPALVGAAAFVVFAMVLEQGMHLLVLRPQADGTTALTDRPILYMLYGCFAAGIFEETARFLSFRLLRRKYGGIGTALSYGVGHGGIEAVLIGGIAMIANLVYTLTLSDGMSTDLLKYMDQMTLAATPSYLFLISGVERMLALTIHIALSVIVFYSVYEPRKIWLYPAAIALHAAVDAPAALAQAYKLTNMLEIEAVILVMTAALAALAVYTHRKLKPA